jgi:hypothetical protein
MPPKKQANVQTPTTFADFKEESNTSIQFSYPRVDNIKFMADNSFFIPNSSTAPSFSLTDGKNNQYISGTAVKGYIASNGIKSNPELVLEHQSMTGTPFYVVIPLTRDQNTKSTVSRLKAGSSVSIDLNSDIPLKNTVYHYLDSSTHMFVFDKPITIGANQFTNNVPTLSTVKSFSNSSTQAYKIKSNTKIEDEVVCGSIEPETAATSKTMEDKKNTTIVYAFGMFLLCIVLIIISMQLLLTMNADSKFWFAVACFPIFIILVALLITYANKPNYATIFGSLTATIVIVGSMALFPNFFKISKPSAEVSTTGTAHVPGQLSGLFNRALVVKSS